MICFKDRTQGITPIQGNYPAFIGRLLAARGLRDEESIEAFLRADMSDLSDPLTFPGMKEAVSLLHRAKENKHHAVVYGDYDCDGVTSTAIMVEALTRFGIPCDHRLPDRHAEGYGLNETVVREIAKEAQLLITVDNGITAVKEIALAKELGMMVILTDHHRPHEVIPPADAIVCPSMGGYPCPFLCGAGVAWFVALALLGRSKTQDLLDLCALGTVADMVPLLSQNRILAREGLTRIALTKRPGLKALLQISMVRLPLSSTDISFRLAPRINACGRIESADLAYELLTTRDEEHAKELAVKLQQLNDARKTLQDGVIRDAVAQLSQMDLLHHRSLVLWSDKWESGVVGLAAGQLAQQFGYPTVVLTVNGELAVGSARSAGGIDIHEALAECADLFERFGGHKQAAGMTLKAEKLPLFRERLDEAVKKQCGGAPLYPIREYDGVLSFAELTVPACEWLSKLEPFGMLNPQPVFLAENVLPMNVSRVGADGAHLRGSFKQANVQRNGIGFYMGDLKEELPEKLSLLFTPSVNDFGGVKRAEMRLSALRPAEGCVPEKHVEACDALLSDLAVLVQREPGEMETPVSMTEAKAFIDQPQGVMILCRSAESAREALQMMPGAELCIGSAADPHAYNAVCHACCMQKVTAPFERILLYDGEIFPGEAAAWAEKTGAAVQTMKRSGECRYLSGLMHFSIEQLREVYKVAMNAHKKNMEVPDLRAFAVTVESRKMTEEQALACLHMLRSMGHIRFELTPFMVEFCPKPNPVKQKYDVENDPFYKAINQEY